MIPLLVFLVACGMLYFAVVETAFGGLMRLTQRIEAEREGEGGSLAEREVRRNGMDLRRGQYYGLGTRTDSTPKADAVTDCNTSRVLRNIDYLPSPLHADHEGDFGSVLIATARHQQVGEIECSGMHTERHAPGARQRQRDSTHAYTR